ncbi:Peroxin-3 [Ancylostoma ceylanicum]|uniref:Peroxisomal biogenesis factor 3 n=1 Tax=Ancylostoma ceylanicum TaxID=53326 RepID=A0A0D6LF78_9BILA|nr:Peroxin-3 [Ancylostoma ceylanicum]
MKTGAGPRNSDSGGLIVCQLRRRYVFDTNQRACDKSITDLIGDLKTRIQLRFDVESLITKLKESTDLPVDAKVELWDKVKVFSIARIVGVAYCYSLLTVTMKAQISILAADVCAQFENPPPQFSSLKARVVDYFGLDSPSNLGPLESNDSSAVAGSRKIFVQCTQYFLTSGIAKLLQCVEDACKDVSSTLLLTDEVTSDRMREMFETADQIISKKESSFFSDLVAPLTESEKGSNDAVMQLLTRLVRSIESEKCRETLSSLIDFYLTAAVHKMPTDPIVLAKLLPSFPDVFDFVASDAFDSPLQNSLCSSDIYQYANLVFKTL